MSANALARLGLAALGPTLLAGCSSYGWTTVFNDTGATLIVNLPPAVIRRAEVKLRPGGHKAFSYRDVGAEPLRVRRGGCVYRYSLPLPGRAYLRASKGEANTNVQIEPDFGVLLLPPSARTVMSAAAVAKAQAYGYPIRPVSRICG